VNTRQYAAAPLIITGFIFLILFGIIAWGVYFESGWVTSFDLSWIERIQTGVSEGKTTLLMRITELGNIRFIIVLTIVIALVLFFKRRYAEGLWFGGTILFCAAVMGKILKETFDRERPQFMQLVERSSESFPSGHATATTIFYGLIGLVIVLAAAKAWQKFAAGLITLAWIVFILVTRVYLGIHFPTDVVAGFLYGLAAIFLSLGIYFIVQEPLRQLLRKMKLNDQSRLFRRARDH
jgi:undecaprenyl-diphosphatase